MPWVTITTISVSRLAGPQVDELGLQPGSGQGVEGAERLVEQERPGFDRERPGHGARAAACRPTPGAGCLSRCVPQADAGEVALDGRVDLLAATSPAGPSAPRPATLRTRLSRGSSE